MLCISDLTATPRDGRCAGRRQAAAVNHKQNDALGLYLDLLIQAINTGTINAEDWQKVTD